MALTAGDVIARIKTNIGAPARGVESNTCPITQLRYPARRKASCPAPEGGARTTRRSVMKLRLYRMAFTASVVAVFLQGLGAGMKWS